MVTSPLLPVPVGEDVMAGEISPKLSVETVTELRLGESRKSARHQPREQQKSADAMLGRESVALSAA
jgi:hypothetical protein